ncbi:MAG: hypothetical protein J6Z34_00005, partial [Clostridia bacterium]|nr:hypothetical protein [Clostridia bacterium]
MKKLVTTFLAGVLSLALFIPSGCTETGEYISNYGKYADRFDFSDEELYDSDYYYEIKEQIAWETPQKTTIVENGEEKEVDIYP